MAADDSDIRAVLREHGMDPPAKGKLGAKWRAEYETITGHSPDAWDGPDDDGDVITATVPPRAPGADDDDTAGESPGEQRPRRRKGPGLRARLSDARASTKGKTGSSGKKRPRVPVDSIISRGWGYLSRMTAPVSGPLSRTLWLQSPVAGLLLEDAVRDTVADRVLQPIARAEQRGEKVIALAAPPFLVVAVERAQGLPEPQRMMQLAVLEPMLVESLTLWVKIAGDKMEQAAERVAETEAVRAQVAALLEVIFPRATVEHDEQAMAGAAA